MEAPTIPSIQQASGIAVRASDESARRAVPLAGAVSLGAAGLWILALMFMMQVSVWLTPRPLPAWNVRLAALPPGPPLELGVALRGREVFETSCSTCHSSSGLGRQGLGKDLVHSDFVADRNDADLAAFVLRGRAIDDPLNTTKVAMPPKGGNDTLTETDIAGAVAYVRGLQDPRRMPDLPAWVPPAAAPPTEAEKAKALAAAGGDAELAGYIASGTKLFASTCAACHGSGGVGIKGNGKALANNEFVKSLDDDALLAFIKHGRDPSDPKNTTGVGMPARGGNPALSDDDLLDIISYVRTLQPPKAATENASK